MNNQLSEFTRTESLFGHGKFEKIQNAHIAVFGIGGVGGYVVEALVRSGIQKIDIIDNDTVSLTNINRQSIALHSTEGRYKTEVMKEKIADICPEIRVRTYERFVLTDNLGDILDERPDYIIDAIDTVTAKLTLVCEARKRGIPIISSMGTGNKLHPEMFEITDITKTSVCPLCKVMRKELKNRGIGHLKVVYSKEKPIDTSGRDTGEDAGVRRSIPGSISFTPPVAGLLIAGEVIRELAGLV